MSFKETLALVTLLTIFAYSFSMGWSVGQEHYDKFIKRNIEQPKEAK
jgi:hypothetical protein